MFKKMILAGACAMSIGANAAPAAKIQPSIYGIHLGDSIDRVKSTAPFLSCDVKCEYYAKNTRIMQSGWKIEDGDDRQKIGNYYINELKVEFDSDKKVSLVTLTCGGKNQSAAQFDIYFTLKEKYGKPNGGTLVYRGINASRWENKSEVLSFMVDLITSNVTLQLNPIEDAEKAKMLRIDLKNKI